jgi:hypothetical protein
LALVVVSTRAEPFSRKPGVTTLSFEKGVMSAVVTRAVPPSETVTAEAEASLSAAPPAGPKNSTPMVTGIVSVFVQARTVAK